MPDLGRSGDYLQSLGARVHDAVTVVAGSEEAILALQGLTVTILQRPIADVNEVYTELDRFDRTEQRYVEIARAGEQWQEEIDRSLKLAFSSRSLSSTTALALSLATGIELWRQESQLGKDGLLLAFTVATPDSADSESVRLTFAEPHAVLVLRPRSIEVLLTLDRVVQGGRWVLSLVRGAAGRIRSAKRPLEHSSRICEKRRRNSRTPYPLFGLMVTAPYHLERVPM